jgi:hypothetical protein
VPSLFHNSSFGEDAPPGGPLTVAVPFTYGWFGVGSLGTKIYGLGA